MKTNSIVAALALMMTMTAACTKEDSTSFTGEPQDEFAPPPSDRCGCSAPAEIYPINGLGTSVEITWNEMPEATGYQVEFSTVKFSGRDRVKTFTTESGFIAFTGLQPQTEYQVRITTQCKSGVSSMSPWMPFNSGGGVHGDPGTKKTIQALTNYPVQMK